MDVVKEFANGELDYVYIDGNHDFQNVTNDIAEWSKKVRKGGIVSGHDYERHKGPSLIHVVEVVNGYTAAYRINPWFVVSRHRPTDGIAGDISRSWMWVKE